MPDQCKSDTFLSNLKYCCGHGPAAYGLTHTAVTSNASFKARSFLNFKQKVNNSQYTTTFASEPEISTICQYNTISHCIMKKQMVRVRLGRHWQMTCDRSGLSCIILTCIKWFMQFATLRNTDLKCCKKAAAAATYTLSSLFHHVGNKCNNVLLVGTTTLKLVQ